MRQRLIAICYVGWMFDFYDLVLISFLIPQIGESLRLSHSQETWLLGIGLGFSGFGGILFGWLADRVGRKAVLTWTILLYSFGTALSGMAHDSFSLFVYRALTGLGLGGEWAVGHAWVAESVPIEKRGRASALLQSGEPVGVALAAVMGLLVAPWIGWRSVFMISSLTALWALIVRNYLPESELWKNSRISERRSRSLEYLKWMMSGGGASLVARAFILAVFKLSTYWTCYIWLPKFFLLRFHEAIGRSALWIVTAQVGQLIGMLGFGPISDFYGRRQAYFWYSLLTASSICVLAFRWEWLMEQRFYFWLTMFGLGLGSGCTAGFGALLAELFPTEIRNFAMGTTYNMARGVQFFAPFLVAFFADRWDVRGALMVPMVLAICTAFWVWTLPETRTRDLARIPI